MTGAKFDIEKFDGTGDFGLAYKVDKGVLKGTRGLCLIRFCEVYITRF